jgi:hypothetical protein
MPHFFEDTKERLILKAEDVSRTMVYEATHFKSSAKRRWRSANAKKRRFKRKLMELLRIADRGDLEYNDILYKSPEELRAIAYGRMQDLRCGFPPLFPDEIYANPNAIRSPFTQYPPSSLTTPESIFNRLYCGEPCPTHPPNMMYSASGNWLFNPYMENYRQELVCPKPKAKHQRSESHKPKKYQNSDSHKPKAKHNNAVYDNRQRPKPCPQKSNRSHKTNPTPSNLVCGNKSKSTTSIESPASAKHRRSFESFTPVVTTETDATQVSIETEAKTITEKEYYDVAAAQVVPKIVIPEEPVKKDVVEVTKMLAAAETVAKIGIADELVKEKGPKEAPKEDNQKATKVEATKMEATKMEATKFESDKAVSSSRGSKCSIADRIATLRAKLVQENDRSTKRSIPRIRVDVAKEIAKVERISKIAEQHKREPKVEIKNSQDVADLLQEIDSKMLVQAADEYALSKSKDLKVSTKTAPKDIEQTIPEPANDLSFKHLDADARTQRFNIHYNKYFADREKRIAIHKKRGYTLDALFTRAHGKYLGDVYGRQIEKIGIDSSVRDFLAKKLLEECKSVQFLNRELTKSELEELREAILFCNNQFYEGIHPQVIKDDVNRILFRSPLTSLYYYNREYQEFDQWLCCQIEESKLLSS